MNSSETIKWLGAVNASKCYPKTFDEINKNLPYFEVTKDVFGKYGVHGSNYIGHDNEDRMAYILEYLQKNVFPNIDKKLNVSGFYNIELHDSYTYLNNGKNYKDCLTFAKYKNDNEGILIPDPYFIGNWGNQLMYVNDSTEWVKKKSKIIFAGTTTGNRNPILNTRIQTCIWSLNKDKCDFYITKIAQMKLDDIISTVPRFNEIYRPPVSVVDQLLYRYHLIIDGNTCRYDIFPYKTNSLVFKYKSKEMLWYYPILQNKTHHVDVDTNSIENTYMYYENNAREVDHILYNANTFANNMFKPIVGMQYSVALFEQIANNK